MKKFVIAAAVVALSATSALAGSGGWTASDPVVTGANVQENNAWHLTGTETIRSKPVKVDGTMTRTVETIYTYTNVNAGGSEPPTKTSTSTVTYTKTIGKPN